MPPIMEILRRAAAGLFMTPSSILDRKYLMPTYRALGLKRSVDRKFNHANCSDLPISSEVKLFFGKVGTTVVIVLAAGTLATIGKVSVFLEQTSHNTSVDKNNNLVCSLWRRLREQSICRDLATYHIARHRPNPFAVV